MCLLVVARHVHPAYPLVVAANRDEFLHRPTAPLGRWDTGALTSAVRSVPLQLTADDAVVAGKDLSAGGTWMAIARSGRFAAVTNVRDPHAGQGRYSRGELPLLGLADQLSGTLADYGPGNVLWGTAEQIQFVTNHGRVDRDPITVADGIHTLSNASLDTPWPKSRRAAADLAATLENWDTPPRHWLERAADTAAPEPVAGAAAEPAAGAGTLAPLTATPPWAAQLLDPLLSRQRAARSDLPDTGIGIVAEWFLSSPFVRAPGYGTRSQMCVVCDVDGRISCVERRFDATGALLSCYGAVVT